MVHPQLGFQRLERGRPAGRIAFDCAICLYMKFLLITSALLFSLGLSSLTQEASAQAYIVKNGSFNLCEGATVEDLVDNFVYNPEWESLIGDDLNRYVNLYGVISYAGVDVDMTL